MLGEWEGPTPRFSLWTSLFELVVDFVGVSHCDLWRRDEYVMRCDKDGKWWMGLTFRGRDVEGGGEGYGSL